MSIAGTLMTGLLRLECQDKATPAQARHRAVIQPRLTLRIAREKDSPRNDPPGRQGRADPSCIRHAIVVPRQRLGYSSKVLLRITRNCIIN